MLKNQIIPKIFVCKYQSKICQKKMMLPFDNPIIDMLKTPSLGCLYRLQRVGLKRQRIWDQAGNYSENVENLMRT